MKHRGAIILIAIALLAVPVVRLTHLANYDSMAKVVRLAELSGVSFSFHGQKIQCSASDWKVLATTLDREGWRESVVDMRDCQGRPVSYSVFRNGRAGVAVEILSAGKGVVVQPEALIYVNCE
ncbi:MAG: hypothetical protein ACK53G_07275 [Armatimonadota bacterium]|jgi:hypothetical protein